MSHKFFGIANYQILDNGNKLEGCFTNTECLIKNVYFTIQEVAEKVSKNIDNEIEGKYICRYNEITCDLLITATNHRNWYKFIWSENDQEICTGKGLLDVTNNTIAVSYSGYN